MAGVCKCTLKRTLFYIVFVFCTLVGIYEYCKLQHRDKEEPVSSSSGTIAVTIDRAAIDHKYHPVAHDNDSRLSQETDDDKQYDIDNMNRPCDTVMNDFNISKSNYVMALSYREQLSMATNSLCTLVNLARGWRSRVVTPFTLNSELYGLQSTDYIPKIAGMTPSINQGPTKPLSILYDMKKLNSDLFCNKYRLPPLAPFDEFIHYANRRITLIHIIVSRSTSTNHSDHTHQYIDCEQHVAIKTTIPKLLQALNIKTRQQQSPPFIYDSACCILSNTKMTHSPFEISKGCGFTNTQSISIVFTIWRGYYHGQPNHPTHRLVVAKTPLFKAPSADTDVYPLSEGIVSNASEYATGQLSCSRNHVGGFVAIHFRTAKLDAMGGGKEMFQSCFDKTHLLLSMLEENCSLQKTCMSRCRKYFVDYGEYGSHSYRIKGGRKLSKDIFRRYKIKPVHYNPRKYGGMQDQGYVASVEQLAIAHASILILVGHGGFQDQVLSKFIELGHGSKAYRLCQDENETVKLVYDSSRRKELQ